MEGIDEQNLSWVPAFLADTILELSEKAIMRSLDAYGHADERAKREARESANAIFVGEHGLSPTYIVRSSGDFVQDVDFISVIENENIAAMIGEGSEMLGITMVEWLGMAVAKQFVRDVVAQGVAEGRLVFTGEMRGAEPVFADVFCFSQSQH